MSGVGGYVCGMSCIGGYVHIVCGMWTNVV